MTETNIQPLMNKKMMVRTAILVGLMGILIGAVYFYNKNKDDWDDLAKADTNGWLTAIESGADGDQVVFVKPDGTIVHDKSYVAGSYDRELTWSPDGNKAFFISDRLKDAKSGTRSVHVFRWNASNEESQARTSVGRSRSNPTFPVGEGAASDTVLLVSGGEVLELDPKTKTTSVVLPPRTSEGGKVAGEGEGKQGAFASAYGDIGTSFRLARWCKGKQWIAAIMHREEGDILVCQSMTQHDGKYDPPIPLVAGEHIDLTVSPATGAIFFAVRDFQWPTKEPPKEWVKEGKVTRPFAHIIGSFDMDPKSQSKVVLVAPSEKICFGSPAVSPDGKQIIAVVGDYSGDGGISPNGLLIMPSEPVRGIEPKGLVRGLISDPSWNPNGHQILFLKRDQDNVRSIFRVTPDSSSPPEPLTKGKLNYSTPLFSPQTK